VVIIVAVVVVILATAAFLVTDNRRRQALRSRFGPEYDRAVDRAGNRRDAERDLRAREARHDELELHPLSDASRDRFQREWSEVQQRFVDRPQVATNDADELITSLMRERGYPVDDFEAKSSVVSVDHPTVVENYRRAHEISNRNEEGRATTEDLRQALISYRSLFEEMLADANA
jgi:hypothetical protein